MVLVPRWGRPSLCPRYRHFQHADVCTDPALSVVHVGLRRWKRMSSLRIPFPVSFSCSIRLRTLGPCLSPDRALCLVSVSTSLQSVLPLVQPFTLIWAFSLSLFIPSCCFCFVFFLCFLYSLLFFSFCLCYSFQLVTPFPTYVCWKETSINIPFI